MNRPWKLIIILLGIFVAGVVTGGFVGLRLGKNALMNRPIPEEWAPKHTKRLIDRLALTTEQSDLIRPIVRHHMEQLKRLRSQALGETQSVLASMQREIAKNLTDEQRVKFEKMNRDLREMREGRERVERERGLNHGRPMGGKVPENPPGGKAAKDQPAPDRPAGN